MEFIDLIDEIVKKQSLYHSLLEGNEAETRWLLIDSFLLDGLGFSKEDIIVEYSLDSINRKNKYNKLDYCVLMNNKPKLLVEAKSLGIDLFDKYSQLEEYFLEVLKIYDYKQNELIGILTDGDMYLFYTNSIEEDKMDMKPFFAIRLSVSEDFMRNSLLEFSKEKLQFQSVDIDNIGYDEEYEVYTEYRIDNIEGVINYFNSKGQMLEIDKVYINGKYKSDIKTFKKLYRTLIREVDSRKPHFLYSLAKQEDINTNGKILNVKFSCKKINSSDIEYSTKDGIIYITLPITTKGVIDRIIYLAKISDFGLHNIMVSMKFVKKGC